jgi:hypothetical protein
MIMDRTSNSQGDRSPDYSSQTSSPDSARSSYNKMIDRQAKTSIKAKLDDQVQSSKTYEFPQWEIKLRDACLPLQTKALDLIRKRAGLERRPQRVQEVVSSINSELRKMRELLESSCFEHDLKQSIRNQMDTYVQDVNKFYGQAIRYNRYVGVKGRSDREQGGNIE